MAFQLHPRSECSITSLIFFITASPGFAQQLSIGGIGGTNLTDDFRSGATTYPSGDNGTTTYRFSSSGRHFIIGLKADFMLPKGWSIEADALHRNWSVKTTVSYSSPLQLPNGLMFSGFGPVEGAESTWEFPVLAKYRLPWNFFVSAGPSFRPAGSGSALSHSGFTTGGGLDWMTKGFRISPTIRYTRWSTPGSFGNSPGSAQPYQVELLVGFDRPGEGTSSRPFSVFGRKLSVGAIVGVGLGRDFKPGVDGIINQVPESNSGIFGAMLEAGLVNNLSLEVDGLYRPLHGADTGAGGQVRFAHLTWEFPVLLKYRLLEQARWHPFVEGGPSFRAEGNLNLPSVSHFGGTVGAGIETKLRKLKIAPAIRYTRWSGGDAGLVARAWENQTQVLAGFSF